MAPIPNPPERAVDGRGAATSLGLRGPPRRSGGTGELADSSGRGAIASANREARETSHSTAFVGGVQVFAYDPGRLYEVWTAPLRVTTLSLAPGETIVSKAAGDTVRWQIGETTSGQGAAQRAHVMIKPLRRGLETNLVLTTNQRVYLVELKSGAPETFNAAVTWDLGAVVPSVAAAETAPKPEPLATPAGPLDARFRIEPRGRRPAWTPTAVMTDGVRTFLTFPTDLAAREAPALFIVGPGGETQLVNYRQQGGLWVVDRVFDAAELRVGDRRPQIVRIVRSAAGPS
jgi:type IV secretion system protein VirB9